MKNQQLHFCFHGEEIAYQVVLPAVRSYLQLLNLGNAGLIEVAIAEAVSNAMRASGDQFVNIHMYVNSSHSLLVRIRDHGKGFDVEKAKARMVGWDKEIPAEFLYAESGRGLWVIYRVFDKVQFNHSGNELLLVKNLSR